MAISVDELVRELRGFDGRREIVKAIAKGVRKAAGPVRKDIRAAAIDMLPERHGLGAWVAKLSITATVRVTSRSGRITLRGGRKSSGARSDLNRIDAGVVRAPSWGRRYGNAWHNQAVTPGFFTKTAADATQWAADVDTEVDRALEQLRKG